MAVHLEKSGEDLQVEFPFVVATVPHKDSGAALPPDITYGQLASAVFCCVCPRGGSRGGGD